MAKTIKFNLICDNTPVRTIEDLQNNFSIEDVLDYYRNGLLCRWLKVRGYEEELKKVEEIRSEDSMGIIKELIRIFEIPCDPAEVEKSIYILKYKVESENENEQYKQETVAYMAGSKVGELAVKGARKVFEVGKTVVKKVAQKAADIGSRVLEHVGNLVSNFAGLFGF